MEPTSDGSGLRSWMKVREQVFALIFNYSITRLPDLSRLAVDYQFLRLEKTAFHRNRNKIRIVVSATNEKVAQPKKFSRQPATNSELLLASGFALAASLMEPK